MFLDIEKAFDRLWHNGLIRKLNDAAFPDGLVHLIHSYLTNRSFNTDVQGKQSTRHGIQAGVPQGSILGPLLFNLYINDFPSTHNTMTAIYADDTAIMAQDWKPSNINSRLQTALRTAEPWLEKWRVKVNVDKCEAVLFTRRPKHLRKHQHCRPITLHTRPIRFREKVKYLGVWLDRKLIWGDHIQHMTNRANARLKQLYPMLNRESKLNSRVSRNLYMTHIRPLMTYGAPCWAYAAPTRLRRLQLIQNKVLRIISNAPRYTRTVDLHNEYRLERLSVVFKKLATRLYRNSRHSNNPFILRLGNYDHNHRWKHNRPKTLLLRD